MIINKNIKDSLESLSKEEIKYIFNKIKDYNNSITSKDSEDNSDYFDHLEFNALKKLLDTKELLDDYDDATGKIEGYGYRSLTKYYEQKAFGKWEYIATQGSHLEVPNLVNDNYTNSDSYLEYRHKLEKDFLIDLANSDLDYQNKIMKLTNKKLKKKDIDLSI